MGGKGGEVGPPAAHRRQPGSGQWGLPGARSRGQAGARGLGSVKERLLLFSNKA